MKYVFISTFALLFSLSSKGAEMTIGKEAPQFILKTDQGTDFDLKTRKGQWTVLYFYPKSETPGCTMQACAFRDSIDKIRSKGADIFGVSINSVEDQKKFREHHKLNFTLLADEKNKVTELFGAKMPLLSMAKRWTFILDPDLKIVAIDKNVDPVKDADHVAQKLSELQAAAKK